MNPGECQLPARDRGDGRLGTVMRDRITR